MIIGKRIAVAAAPCPTCHLHFLVVVQVGEMKQLITRDAPPGPQLHVTQELLRCQACGAGALRIRQDGKWVVVTQVSGMWGVLIPPQQLVAPPTNGKEAANAET